MDGTSVTKPWTFRFGRKPTVDVPFAAGLFVRDGGAKFVCSSHLSAVSRTAQVVARSSVARRASRAPP